jgi:hypothetical protein
MPVKWEIRDPMLILTVDGDYRADDLVRALVEAMGAPTFRPGLFVLGDGRHSKASISAADTDWRVEWLASLPKMGFASRYAVVVNHEAHRFGLARMISTRLETRGVDLGIFRRVDEAMEWLTGHEAGS